MDGRVRQQGALGAPPTGPHPHGPLWVYGLAVALVVAVLVYVFFFYPFPEDEIVVVGAATWLLRG